MTYTLESPVASGWGYFPGDIEPPKSLCCSVPHNSIPLPPGSPSSKWFSHGSSPPEAYAWSWPKRKPLYCPMQTLSSSCLLPQANLLAWDIRPLLTGSVFLALVSSFINPCLRFQQHQTLVLEDMDYFTPLCFPLGWLFCLKCPSLFHPPEKLLFQL